MTAPAIPAQRTSGETGVDVDVTRDPKCSAKGCEDNASWFGWPECACTPQWGELLCQRHKTICDEFAASERYMCNHCGADVDRFVWRAL